MACPRLLTARDPRMPLALLAAVCVLSLGARVALIGAPCRSPCQTANDHVLIFDEDYYVNAARVIAGIRPPAGVPYARAPLGVDPNAEHPQLAKLVMAGSIELFGDGPLAWRLGSIVFGTVAILGMFALVRAAGGSRWAALGAAALMAADNLLLVHGRIGTLDIYALAGMLWGCALYLRGRPVLAGAVIGVASCAKLVAPYVLLVIFLWEALRLLAGERAAIRAGLRQLASCILVAAGTLVGLLALLDLIAQPYDDANAKLVKGSAFSHLQHMFDYAAHQTSPHGPKGIASYPWQWLVDYKPITYLNINPAQPAAGLYHVHPAAHFMGVISPPVLVAGLPGLLFALWMVLRRRRPESRGIATLAVAWFLGTFLPFVALSLLWSRTSYLYYMVIVMPGLYAGAVYLICEGWPRARVQLAWLAAAAVAAAAVIMYPFTPTL